MSMFTHHRKVRFEDCDPAGIVFYPNYILMLHRHFEDWFADGLGISLGTMNLDRKIGFPIKNLNVDFQRPSRLEDVLEWKLQVISTGTSSITLGVEAECIGETRITVKLTVVAVNLSKNPIVPCSIPEDIREQILKFKNEN
ncbi:acyl-CoA thioesterase [Desulforhopalus singaporensis]|uniref:4-hydroxybenzoyl-CoA thioesterase n=1 Tax=Desulforhopalus singaporensis TaxID=91360 RepID=A0A1H0P101_9BACT|nr:thioesterase family protein [Desulforhopalus singaporensis]SDO98621.1 4-hydroxybenzoyl-CoA thioesterase [Desulforhopalus singaporensis]